MAEPVSTIGASNPTLPPRLTVTVLAISEVYILCALIMLLLLEMDCRIRLMPCPILSFTRYLTYRYVSKIPKNGRTRYKRLKLLIEITFITSIWL